MKELKPFFLHLLRNPIFWVLLIIALLIVFIALFEGGVPAYLKGMYNIF